MKKPSLGYLRIEIACPRCHQKNMERIGDLIKSQDFLCSFCKNPLRLGDDEAAKAQFEELIDFVEHAYIPGG